ncbi:hypothetical protein COO91_07360 [Nostoc flagelliforme CCNUN1]|uniref:Uncharacterized protein n=1 Tax=Nostoc flagelliforme CCNUN1 TaxID=2038116 RepID=A0A2K8T0U3_9NOSO|nr:hypothetical protein COO91_07360 [Nostoc flagelliforme CCNUN1]
MAIAWAGGGQSNVYSLPTACRRTVGKALQANWLSSFKYFEIYNQCPIPNR